MGVWILPDKDNNICHVCLAGAVMYNTLGLRDEPRLIDKKYLALNWVRRGHVFMALKSLGLADTMAYDRYIEDYRENPEMFKNQLRELITDLRKAGL